MKSVLREFIRESLIQERVGRSTFGFATLKPGYGISSKYFDIADAVTDFLISGGGDIASWMMNRARLWSVDARGDITSVLGRLRTSISSGIRNLGRFLIPGSLSLSSLAGPAALAAGGAGIFSAISDYLNKDPSDPGLITSLVEGLGSYFDDIFNVIDDEKIVQLFLLEPSDSDFNIAWPKIKNHYDAIVDRLLSSSNYDQFFRNFDMSSVKSDLDKLIASYDIKDNDQAFKALAYAVLMHDTATKFLPKAIIKDVSVYKGKITSEQQGDVTIYLEILENRILNNPNFSRIQSDFERLSEI